MGMAASQARFLQLTARRTNIEYQGQQINQQRLALANASAGLFEKMLTMVVPTPPSSQDDKYYKQGYTFTDPSDEIQKKISWSSVKVDASDVTDVSGTAITSIDITQADGTAGGTITAAQISGASNGVAADMAAVSTALGMELSDDQKALGYKEVIRNVKIEHNVYDPDGNYTQVTKEAPAYLQFDNLNRLINVVLLNKDEVNLKPDVNDSDYVEQKAGFIGAGESLTYASVFDEVTYQNDVNKYEFQKASYDYQIEQINQETKKVQQQDKSLELKMKQLDTEHNAVQTEMEAVQKVIQKNIEGSFKTFA